MATARAGGQSREHLREEMQVSVLCLKEYKEFSLKEHLGFTNKENGEKHEAKQKMVKEQECLGNSTYMGGKGSFPLPMGESVKACWVL